MFRKDLITILEDNPQSLNDIAILLEMTPRDVEDDVRHLMKSLKHSEYRLRIKPAYCRKCGYKFDKEKLHKPGKCPSCHETWIQEPLLEIEKTK
jgi:predicted Zn-ribbon and HTH transcriptional regulator